MHKTIGLSVVGLALMSGTLLAQQQPVRPTQPGVQPGAQPGARPGAQPGAQPGARPAQPGQPGAQNPQGQQQGDQQIAALIMLCNRNEVETAKFAMNKLQSDEAKEIATKMIKDHTEGMNKFARWAGQAAPTSTGGRESQGDREERPRDENRREGNREQGNREQGNREQGNREEGRRDNDRAETQPSAAPNNAAAANQAGGRTAQPGAAPGGTAPANTAQNANQGNTQTVFRPVSGGALNWTAIHQEIANQSLAGTKEELSRYEGIEFDKAYLGHQLAAHLKAATELKVFKKHASSQLGSEIDNAIANTEEHIKHLRTAMEDKKDEKSNNKR